MRHENQWKVSGLNIDKVREFPTRKMDIARPKKPGGRVISLAVGEETDLRGVNVKPSVFIGSSTEGLAIARAIQLQLDHVAEVVVWTDNVFELSAFTYETLERQLRSAQYGIFILTPDDAVLSRNKKTMAPRDNVVFELGLFVGKIGIKRTFIVHPRHLNLKIPSDLLGITCATYELHLSGNITASIGAACTQIRTLIQTGNSGGVQVSWDQVTNWAKDLATSLKRGPSRGGFTFDAIVGISGGGLIIADLLSRCYGRQHPVISIWADRHSNYPASHFSPPDNWVNSNVCQILSDDRIKNILIIDDITRTGKTIVNATRFLIDNLPGRNIKNAVIIADVKVAPDIDYCTTRLSTENVLLPYAELDN